MAAKFSLSAVALCLLFIFGFTSPASAQHTITSRLSHYQVTMPGTMTKDTDSAENKGDDLIFYDTTGDVIMNITARDGDFQSINAYLDCTKQTLESDLRQAQGDSTLILIDCRRSPFYPEQSAVLHFETKAYPAGVDRCIIYFFHHNKKEIQFSFLYSKAYAKEDVEYINSIMKTLKLM